MSTREQKAAAPERIWLQRHDSPDYLSDPGWSWCWHRIDQDPDIPDVEYVRADLAAPPAVPPQRTLRGPNDRR